MRDAIQQVSCDGDKDKNLRALWRDCVQRMRCLPTDIIGVQNHLAYGDNPADAPDSPIWESEFCGTLCRLFFHTLWYGYHHSLVIALQFAVIVRTGDKRPWRFVNPTEDSFLSKLDVELEKDSHLEPAARRSMETLCEALDPGFPGLRSEWHKLFRAICHNTDVDGAPVRGGSLMETPYAVTLADLSAVRRALRAVGLDTDGFVPTTCSSMRAVTTYYRLSSGQLEGTQALRDALERAVLKERVMRRLMEAGHCQPGYQLPREGLPLQPLHQPAQRGLVDDPGSNVIIPKTPRPKWTWITTGVDQSQTDERFIPSNVGTESEAPQPGKLCGYGHERRDLSGSLASDKTAVATMKRRL